MIRIKKKALIMLFYSTPGRTLRQTAGEVFGSVTNKFAGAKVNFSPTGGDIAIHRTRPGGATDRHGKRPPVLGRPSRSTDGSSTRTVSVGNPRIFERRKKTGDGGSLQLLIKTASSAGTISYPSQSWKRSRCRDPAGVSMLDGQVIGAQEAKLAGGAVARQCRRMRRSTTNKAQRLRPRLSLIQCAEGSPVSDSCKMTVSGGIATISGRSTRLK
jgi:hypothetical protein